MADKVTTTKKGDSSERVRAALDELTEALVESGEDPTTVDAKLHAVVPSETNLVGNFADLQRLGGQQAMKTGGMAAAFELPADVDPDTGQTRGM